MARVNVNKTSFVAGEVSPRLWGRTDISKFKGSARVIENMYVLPHGGVLKRSGTQFVCEMKSNADNCIMVPFQYNVEQSYMLLFGPNYIWFFKDRGIITYTDKTITNISQGGTAVVTSAGHGFSNGDYVIVRNVAGMTEVNNRIFVVSGATANTFYLTGADSSVYTAYSSGGTVSKIVELTTPYSASELSEIHVTQTNDVMYIAHKSHALRKLERSSHTAWTLTIPTIVTGPFRNINPDEDNIITISTASAATSWGTHQAGVQIYLNAVKNTFHPDMVGGLFRLNEEGGGTAIQNAPVGDSTYTINGSDMYTSNGHVYGINTTTATNWGSFTRVPDHLSGQVRVTGAGGVYYDVTYLHPGYCVVKILSYVNAKQVYAQIVKYHLPASIVTSGTSFWEEGSFSDYRGYPSSVTLYENRLFLAGSSSEPTTIWASRSGAYEDFSDGADDDDALVYRIGAGVADTIRWLSASRVLTAGTSAGEYAIAASSQNEALTPSNFKVVPQTGFGTSSTPPIRLDQAILYPQRNGAPANPSVRLREFAYSFQNDAYNSVDISIFAEHVFGDGYNRLSYLLQPNAMIFAQRTDGQLAACTYERAQEVVAWHRHQIGGDATVMAIGSIPGADGDELWMSVRRVLTEQTEITTEAGDTLLAETEDTLVTEDDTDSTVRYVEVLRPAYVDEVDKEDAFMVDSGLTYNGAPTTSITGLWHLRGLTVSILNNGAVETGTVSSTGTLTLSNSTTLAHVGLAYTAVVETEDFDEGAQAGTGQSRAKRISQVWARVHNSLGGTYGTTSADQKKILYRTPADPHGSSVALKTDYLPLDMPSGWDRKAVIRFEHSDPLPFHITNLVAELSVTG